MTNYIGELINKIRRQFTLWYIRKGYSFEYISNGEYIFKAVWDCPWYVRPLLIFFSPSVYDVEANGRALVEGFEEGIRRVKTDPMCNAFQANLNGIDIEPKNCPICGGEVMTWNLYATSRGLDIYYCGCVPCGIHQTTYKNGRNGSIAKWNDFVDRYAEAMDDCKEIIKNNN